MNDSVLAKLDTARTALAEAKTIQETKKILDVATAAEILAKRQKMGEEAISYATSIKVEALAQLGRMLREMPKNEGGYAGNYAGTNLEPAYGTPTLSDIGLDKKTSKLAQDIAKLDENEISKVKEGVIKLSGVSTILRNEEIEKQRKDIETGKVVLPEGKFEVVVIDPPWPYGTQYNNEGRRVANPYPEMSVEEISNIEIPAAKDSVLWLWTTHKFLPESFALLSNWGFEYKATLVWNKEKIGMGHWLRMQCEFCLLGIRGNPLWNNTTHTDIINEPRRQHSRKPESFYSFVDSLCVGRKIDYFSREKREGWYQYGNDANKF